jgi:tetratricopeptide (TPR) repeat protein
VTLPGELFLRHPSGDSIGPLPLRTIEVLYDARVLDESTPVSEDGDSFSSLGQWPELYSHVEDVKDRLGRGEKIWIAPAHSASLAGDLGGPILKQLLANAIGQVSGRLELASGEGDLTVTYKDGKIVAVDTELEELSLTNYLVSQGICDGAAIARAVQRAPEMGGDLGAALISLGVIQPHVYFEKLIAWAMFALGRALTMSFDVSFTPEEIPNPSIPLGFDRFGVLLESVRTGFSRQELLDRIGRKRGCPVIIANVEGAKIEQMKLKPKELRALNSVNGVRTMAQMVEEIDDEEKGISVLRAIFFASECGFVVFGEDSESKKEVAEAEEVMRTLEGMRKKNHLELFNVTEKSSDEEVRSRYTDLAKKYHPDTLRSEAIDELKEARSEIFAFINQVFESIQTETQRFEYKMMLDRGEIGGTDDLEKVQNTLHAETLFKKAEILVKVRKYDEALQHLREAIALNPDDKEFRIYLAYVEYTAATKQKVGNQIELAEVAIRKIQTLMKGEGSNIASGYLLLGHLQKAAAKPDVAAKYFEKVLDYDPNNQEATREVRLHTMRKTKGGKKKGLFGI